MKAKRWMVAGVAFALLWLFVKGAALSAQSLLANSLVGLAVGLPIAYVFRRFYEEEFELGRTVTAVPYIARYILVFTREVVVANLDVAYRVLAPRMPLEPQVIFVPLRVETDLGVTTIANSITITPGTITLDHDPDENALYVHIIDGRNPDDVVEPIRQWEDYALVIFDEERSPADPAPGIRVHPTDYPPEPKTQPEMSPGREQVMETEGEADDGTDGGGGNGR